MTLPTPSPSSTTEQQKAAILSFSDKLRTIWESELVRSDAKAQQIILRMVGISMHGINVASFGTTMREINAQVHVLALRIGELLGEETGDPNCVDRLLKTMSGRRISVSLPSARNGNQHSLAEDATGGRARTFLRL